METEAGKIATDLLLRFVRELVDEPDFAKVETVYGSGGKTVVLTVTTGPGDIGKVIGKKGRTAEALRFVLDAIAAKHRVKLILEIDDGRSRSTVETAAMQ